MNAAPLYEVFSSVQGEATHVGERHLFVRLAGCDLECVFCDTPASRLVPEHARVMLPSGRVAAPNPVSVDDLDGYLKQLDEQSGPHHAVSITGGEPLLFVDYLRPLAERWRAHGWPVLLETGGHLPQELERMLDCVDMVMADIKIASSAGFDADADTARRFLELAARKDSAAKVVCSARTTADEIERAAGLVPDGVPLVLQPVTGSRFDPPDGRWMLALQRAAMGVHRDTRVIPQTHKTLHVR